MYIINSQIKNQDYNKLQVNKLVKTEALEILNISLEKGSIFPEHIAPTDAQLIVLEGEIIFHINGKSYPIKEQQHFSFPKEVPHWVSAEENSKFLIIR
ncbi:cupin domain-containing protein [Arenibacter sp. BSSL-BM3]|uniref:Cupin domain-containing protein n=1 Tax=Arenibacter arenosicollis TaxID=2762274 RepID=A0ABR7QRT9_9FLAO|nr:cupin domain-containing protein [Arenibacter arenosicollis]MBC8769784.1 cupin domain-containing protein [Arenibacter arenosicollis]